MDSLRKWKQRLRHVRSDADSSRSIQVDRAFRQRAEEIEEGLRDIDFEEVTTEDRITFVECVVAWQVRSAPRCGRFDLALLLQRFGAERVAQLYERMHGWRPTLLYGVPLPPGRDAEHGK